MKYIISGIFGMVFSLWLGAFMMVYFTEPAYNFAAFMTAFFIFIGSFALILWGVHNKQMQI